MVEISSLIYIEKEVSVFQLFILCDETNLMKQIHKGISVSIHAKNIQNKVHFSNVWIV